MDFSKFDNRGPAETGQRLELLDPSTKDGSPLLSGTKPCAVIVRGSSARSVQAEMRKRVKSRMANKKNAKSEDRILEDIHNELCDSAAPLIVGFENMERPDDNGKTRPLSVTPEDIKWFLDLTFPLMGRKEDEDGEPVLDHDGNVQFEMKNNPFANQITNFSAEQVANLGNGKTG